MTLSSGELAVRPEAVAVDGDWHLSGIVGGEPGPKHLVVRSGVITELRPGAGAAQRWLVAVPLLVNAHDHGRGKGNVLAGIADAPLEEWIPRLKGGGTTQESLVGDGCRAMLGAGVGATVICVNPQGADVAGEVARAAEAAARAGVRAAIVYPFADAADDVMGRSRHAPGWSVAELAAQFEAVDDVAAAVSGPRIEVQLGPVGPQWVSATTLAAIGVQARRRGRRVHMHLLESPAQRRWADVTYPEGIVEFLRSCDLLGPHVCFAHGTHLRPDEYAALAASGSVVSLNPSSNLRLASGIAPVAEARRSGVCFGAGLDGMALGDDADYWTELRLLRGIGQGQAGVAISADELLAGVIAGGRRALGAAAPADIAEGNVADFVILDLSGYGHLAERSGWTVSEIALAAGRPGRVREVWVGGRAVLCPETGDVT